VSVGGSARVGSVGGSASVDRAAGTSVVHLYRGGTLTRAGAYVAVYLHHSKVTYTGGHVIDVSALDECDPQTWCDLLGVTIDDQGLAHLFKAVDAQLVAGHSYRPTTYTIGSTITDPRWRDDHDCGGGLHTCPTTFQARSHYTSAARFLEVTVPVTDLRPIDPTKAKSRQVTVLREVDEFGDPIEVTL
ncbi:MAG: hypothetical protein M0Z51_16600, partial [Propionibacterium sp.]|nr:hypothetical protein [Propionibacterium sp.]